MQPPDSHQRSRGDRASRLGAAYAGACLLLAIASLPVFDVLTDGLLLLSTFLFLVVTVYSRRYMAGDPGQSRFTFWLCLTASCVFGLILARNLLLFAAAWCGTSLALHQLLQFYRERPGAILAARKKFIISRLGDLALAGVLVLCWREFGSLEFQAIFDAAARYRTAGSVPGSVDAICVLLVFAALLKSAQFPFHSWLPDTMETPTPVSALMHAGIINAGGILVIRLSPLISLSMPAMTVLVLVGAFTAIFAALVMATQASIKRCLAFSTVGQMGFMMLECGLGAFHLALVHLVAHSLYKAHAFLSAGGAALAGAPRFKRHASTREFALCLLAAAGLWAGAHALAGNVQDAATALGAIFTLAVAQLLLVARRTGGLGLGFLAACGAVAVYVTLESVASRWIAPAAMTSSGWMNYLLASSFLLVAIVETQIEGLVSSALGRSLYVHARNGFYINTLANRVTRWVWPVSIAQEEF